MAASTVRLDLLISALTGNISGLTNVNQSLLDVQNRATGLFGMLKQGFAIDISSRMISGLVAIEQQMASLVRTGLAFNQSLESTTIGIAAILRQTDKAGNFKSFGDAFTASKVIVDQLKVAALNSSASFEDMATTYQTVATQMMNAGIPISKQVQLMQLLGNAIKTQLGPMADARQLMTESRALLEGNAMPGATLASSVLASPEDKVAYEQAKQNGTLFEFLSVKLKGVTEGTDAASKSMGVLVSNLNDLKQQLAGALTTPLFENLKKGATELTTFLMSGKIVNSIQPFADAVSKAVGGVMQVMVQMFPVVTSFAAAFAPVFQMIGSGFKSAMDTISTGILKVQAVFSDKSFSARWNEAMVKVVSDSGPLIQGINSIIASLMRMVATGVSIMPELATAIVALSPPFTVLAEVIRIALDSITAISEIMAKHTEIVKMTLQALVALGVGFATFRTVAAVAALTSFIGGALAAGSAAIGATAGMGVLNIATLGLTFSLEKLRLSIMRNPIGFLASVLTTVAAFLITKYAFSNKQAEASVDDLNKAMKNVTSTASGMQKQLLESFKTPPVTGAANVQEERIKMMQAQNTAERQMAELGYQNISKDETVSYAVRRQAAESYYAQRQQLLTRETQLERDLIAIQMTKANADDKASLQTRLKTVDSNYTVERAKLASEMNQSVRSMAIAEANRTEKISSSLLLRTQEYSINLAIISGNEKQASQIQHQIDLENETNKVMQERDQNRASFATAEQYATARAQAERMAAISLQAKERAGAQAYLVDLGNRLSLLVASNSLGELAVSKIQEQQAEEQVLIEARRLENATQGQSVILGQKVVDQMRQQFDFQMRIRQIENQKAMINATTAEAQTAAARVQYDLSSSPEQKEKAQHTYMQEQLNGTNKQIALEREKQSELRKNGEENTQAYAESIAQIESLTQKGLELKNAMMQVGSVGQQVAYGIKQWADAFGSVGAQMTRFSTTVMTTVTQRVSSGIYQMISAGKSFKSIMYDILDGIIQKFIDMAVEFIAQQLVMLVWNQMFKSQMLAQDAAAAAQETAMWTPAALMKSIATMGLAALVGFAIFAAIAGAAGAFAEGGLVPGSPSQSDNRVASVASGEYVNRTSSVQYYGPKIFDALNKRMIPREQLYAALSGVSMSQPAGLSGRAFATGGLVGQAQSVRDATPRASELINNVQVVALDRRNDYRDFMQSSEGQRVIFRSVKRRGLELGIR